eukprot:COSAG02_NODE_1806_length_10867_cov_7.575130_3_plen_148_part_00
MRYGGGTGIYVYKYTCIVPVLEFPIKMHVRWARVETAPRVIAACSARAHDSRERARACAPAPAARSRASSPRGGRTKLEKRRIGPGGRDGRAAAVVERRWPPSRLQAEAQPWACVHRAEADRRRDFRLKHSLLGRGYTELRPTATPG